MSEEVGSKKLGDITLDEFFQVYFAVTRAAEEEGRKGEPRMVDLTVPQLIEQMREVFKSRDAQMAMNEAQVSQRILRDWQGLQSVNAITQPFHLVNHADVDKFAKDLKVTIQQKGWEGTLVVAVAVCGNGHVYKALPHEDS